MDPDSNELVMEFAAGKYGALFTNAKILELGSRNINGTIRDHIKGWAEYVGVDLRPGPGVDVVLEDPNKLPFPDGSFDLVVSSNTLEHCERPWEVVKESARVLKPGGTFFATVPWQIHVHRDSQCPTDCYRILDDGMRALMVYAGLEPVEIRMHKDHTMGVARRQK